MSSKRKILVGLSVAAFLAPLTQTIYTPSLPEIGEFFSVNYFMVNLTISIFTFILATSQFIIGPLADTKGRKAILIPGLILFIIGSVICWFTTDYYLFLFGRMVQAFGISAGSVVAAAVIGDIFSPKDRGGAMSVYQTMVFLGPVLGPLIGSFMSGMFAWKWVFLVLIIAAIFSLIYNQIVLHETLPKDTTPRKITYHTFKKIVSHPSSFSILLLGFIQFYGMYVFLVFLPGLLDRLYVVSVEAKGLLYLPLTAGILLGAIIGGKLQKHFTRKALLTSTSYGAGSVVLVFWAFLISDIMPMWLLIILLLAYGSQLGISLPAQTTAIVNLFQEEKGTAMGTYNFLRFSGAGVGPLLGAIIFNIGGDFALYLSLCLFMMIAAYLIQKRMYDPLETSTEVAS